MKLNKTKIGLVVASLISVMLAVSLVYVVSAQTASTFWITEGVYPSASAYTIWREGSTYYAKNAYGFIPNGCVSSNLTSLWNIVTATEGKIFFKAGTFIVAYPPLIIPSNIFVQGEGAGITIISLGDNSVSIAGQPVFINSNYPAGQWNYDITIKDLTVYGNKENNPTSYGWDGGIVMSGVERCTIENVVVNNTNGWAGIYLNPAHGNPTPPPVGEYWTRSFITNCIVQNTSAYLTHGKGIYVSAVRNGSVIIDGNIVIENAGHGIHIEDVGNVTVVTNNIMLDNAGSGISLTTSRGCVVSDNILIRNNYGISSGYSYGNIISNNIARINQREGIYLINGSNNTVVSGNNIEDNGQVGAGAFLSGIFLHDTWGCSITGNRVFDTMISWTQYRGIYTQGTSNFNLITTNNVYRNGHATDDIDYVGANSTIADNLGRYTPQNND